MNQFFLLLVHQNPEQLQLLLKQLESEESHFLIHLDLKSNISEFKHATQSIKNITYIEERYNVGWGSFNMVKATLALIKEVLNQDMEYSHAHLLSGEDILIKPVSEANTFFSGNADTCYMQYFKLPCKYWHKGGIPKLTKYYFENSRRGKSLIQRIPIKIFERFVNIIGVRILPFLKKKLNKEIDYYGGSQWWSLTKESLIYIYKYVQENPSYVAFFKYSHIPDEIFFQTILLNSDLKTKIAPTNKRYIDWSHPEKGMPAVLGMDEYEILIQSNDLFARKIDFKSSSQLYTFILSNSASSAPQIN